MIGTGRPFVIIGERINPTGRKKLAEEMKAGDFTTVIADTQAQIAAGAHMLDVNAGIPLADEPAILAETVRLVQSLTDVPLSIDSSIVAALEAGLAVYEGKPLVNSVTGEDDRLESVLPLVAKHGAAVVAITNDETGISEDPDVRFAVAREDRASRRRPRHRGARHRGRPARDADRGDGHGGPPGLLARAPAARRARREHHLRSIERVVRSAEPARAERRVPVDGDRQRHDERDHEPPARGGPPGGHGRRRADGRRRPRRRLDRPLRRGSQRGRVRHRPAPGRPRRAPHAPSADEAADTAGVEAAPEP